MAGKDQSVFFFDKIEKRQATNWRRCSLSTSKSNAIPAMTNQITVESPAATHTIQNRVIDLISWRLNMPVDNIHPYSRLQEDLYLDAIDLMLLIAELESRFNAYLSAEEYDAIETVEDATNYLMKYAA
jgi:acyl carrier protein